MQAFKTHTGTVMPLDRANIDTDAIIPKQYLKSIRRTGFEKGLFSDWRYDESGTPVPSFELNMPQYQNATILLTRHNFGCGSSREHAVWAIAQYGFKAIIAPWQKGASGKIPAFADIFYNNSIRNGLLCIELDPDRVDKLFNLIKTEPHTKIVIDLEKQTIKLPHDSNFQIDFSIDPGVKTAILTGADDITMTLMLVDEITAFENQHDTQMENPL